MERLNYFNPYASKAAWHEDQLTRAFLVVLRLVPLARAWFIELVRDRQIANGSGRVIPSVPMIDTDGVAIRTQVETLGGRNGTVVSVVMSDDHWTEETRIQASSRRARYDGVIRIGSEWILAIENKPRASNIKEAQLHPSVARDAGNLEVDPVLVDMQWQAVVERLMLLVEQRLVTGCEALVVEDFVDFVDSEFHYLSPYTSFARCGNDEYRLERRCRSILEQISSSERVDRHRKGHYFIGIDSGPARAVLLYPKMRERGDWSIRLAIHPGVTVSQAREFFDRVDRNAFLSLRDRKWLIEPNLLFAYMATILHWGTTDVGVEEYFDRWSRESDGIGQYRRDGDGFEGLFTRLHREKMISDGDLPELRRHFSETKQDRINVCPGFNMYFDWKKDEAIRLDQEGKFAEVVKERIADGLQTWGGTLDT